MNFKIVKRKEVQTTWEQWPGSNCSNRRSFEQQINEQIRYAVQLYQFRMSLQLYSQNSTISDKGAKHLRKHVKDSDAFNVQPFP